MGVETDEGLQPRARPTNGRPTLLPLAAVSGVSPVTTVTVACHSPNADSGTTQAMSGGPIRARPRATLATRLKAHPATNTSVVSRLKAAPKRSPAPSQRPRRKARIAASAKAPATGSERSREKLQMKPK